MIIRRKEFLEKGTSGTFLKRLGLVRKQMGRGDFEVFRCDDHEVAVIPLTGMVDIKATGEWGTSAWLDVGGRESVFDELPTLVMLPSCRLMLNAHEPVDVLVATLSGRKGLGLFPYLLRPEDLDVNIIGEGNHRRKVVSAQQDDWVLKIGETVHVGEGGTWSSWPKHLIDGDTKDFEELKLVIVKNVVGWGEDCEEPWAVVVQDGTYGGKEIHEVHKVVSGDVIIQPAGRHPIVGAPATKVWYLWAMVGDAGCPKRYGKFAGERGGYV